MSAASQLETLRPYIARHEAGLAELRARAEAVAAYLDTEPPPDDKLKPLPPRDVFEAQLEALQRAIATHERLFRMASDERIGEALDELATDRELARQVATDPARFANERGIEIPERMTIFLFADEQMTVLRVAYLDDDLPFVLDWTPDGFRPPSAPPEAPQDAA
jgi:hypothetical protein